MAAFRSVFHVSANVKLALRSEQALFMQLQTVSVTPKLITFLSQATLPMSSATQDDTQWDIHVHMYMCVH